MATDNTVEIGFNADTSNFTDGVETAGDALDMLQDRLDSSFGGAGDAIRSATQPLQALSAGLTQVRDALGTSLGAQLDAVGSDTATLSRQMQQYYQAAIEGAAKADDAQIATEQALVAQKKTLGEISAGDAIAQLESLAAQEDQINQARIAAMRAVYAASGNAGGVARENDDQVIETQRYTQQIIKLNTEAAQQTQAAWDKAFQPIGKAFDSAIDGMVRGTQTFNQTVQRMAQSIAAEYADSAAQGALHWVASEAQKTAATLAGNAARTASTQGASTEGTAIEGAANKESVVGNAWSAAAAVYNNVSQIPYVGWVLAPAAAAAAAAAVLGFGDSIPSAAGGWVVPGDTLAMVHQNEMILPAHLSQGLSGMIANGQAASGHTFNNTFNMQGGGITARELPDMIVKTMSKAARNGQFGGMRTA